MHGRHDLPLVSGDEEQVGWVWGDDVEGVEVGPQFGVGSGAVAVDPKLVVYQQLDDRRDVVPHCFTQHDRVVLDG